MSKTKLMIKKILIGKRPIVIMLHSVDNDNDSCAISFENFISFVDCFKEEIKNKRIVLTFDDGFESVYTKCFKYLFKKKLPFVCFLVTDFIGKPNYLSEKQIFEMLKSGLLTIGSHGKTHVVLNKLKTSDLENEIIQSKKILEKVFGLPVSIFAYSHGFYDKKTIKMVKKAGYRFAYAATSNLSDYLLINKYKIPRYNLKEGTISFVREEIGFYEKKSI